MNTKLAKKLRKYSKRNWKEYVREIYALPLKTRLLYAWHIIIKY